MYLGISAERGLRYGIWEPVLKQVALRNLGTSVETGYATELGRPAVRVATIVNIGTFVCCVPLFV